jgi:hypothetical protein
LAISKALASILVVGHIDDGGFGTPRISMPKAIVVRDRHVRIKRAGL